MFEPSDRKVEHKIRKLEEEIKGIDKEIERITNRMKELSGTLILPKYRRMYTAILNEINSVSAEITKIVRKIGEEKLEILHNTSGKGIIDISGIDPGLVKRYISLQKRMDDLLKQERHIENLSDVDKHAQLRADGFNMSELKKRKERAVKEVTGLKKARR
jgi:hypothetical protein